MGLDTGFTLRLLKQENKDIKTPEEYRNNYVNLLYFARRPSNSLENLITSISEPLKEICYIGYDESTKEWDKVVLKTPSLPDTNYLVNLTEFKTMLNKIKPIAKLLAKYSDRVIQDLTENFEDKELSKQDRATLKDLLYELDSDLSYDDVFYLLKLYNFFEQFFKCEFIELDTLKFELHYWRSY